MQENPFSDLIPPSAQNGQSVAPQIQNPFADLIPAQQNNQQNSTMPKKSLLDDIIYAGDSAAKGLRHAISAPAQFVNPLIDAVAGTDLAGSLGRKNKALDEQYYKKYPDVGYVGDAISDIGEFLPSMFVGGSLVKAPAALAEGAAKIPALLKGAASLSGHGAAAGVLTSPLAYDETGNMNPLQKAALGGLTGAIAAPALVGAGKAVQSAGGSLSKLKGLLNPSGYAEKEALGDISNIAETLAKKEAANRIGVNLRPSEASQNTLTAAAEADLGFSKPGAELLEKQAKIRQQEEKSAITGLLNDLVPEGKNKNVAGEVQSIAKKIQDLREKAMLDSEKQTIEGFLGKLAPEEQSQIGASVRDTAKSLLKTKREELSEKARPIYEEAYAESVHPNKFNALIKKDGAIRTSVKRVLGNPDYQVELAGYKPNSIKVLDLAKRDIDSRISQAMNTGDREQSRILQAAKDRLVTATDKYSPTYAKARAIYGEGAKPIQALENSSFGKLANLNDDELNKVTKTIFNPQETNMAVLGKMRDEISSASPDLWKKIVRSEMERRLDRSINGVTGENFHKQILGKNLDYKQFKEAVKGYPDLTKDLESMKARFVDSKHNMQIIKNTDIGRLSRMKDSQLKNVSKTIFDPAQTNINHFKEIRDNIQKESPAIWNNITRNEIERRMAAVKNNRHGSKFYNSILENDNSYNQFLQAMESNPKAQSKLKDMKEVFGSLINVKNAREAYNKRSNNLDIPRNTFDAAAKLIKKMVAGDYDKAALQLIFSNKWDEKLKSIQNIKNAKTRDLRIVDLLASISGATPTLTQYTLKD